VGRERLATLATQSDGELVQARAAHTAALAEHDAVALEGAAHAFERMGAWLYAAEALADAGVMLRRAGNARAAAAAERRAGSAAARCEGAVTPALRGIGARARLAPAELDTARLAAAGRSNKEIAGELYLSIRTVENRLQRIYEKLGVTGRSELAGILDAM
jgi:DNA-binding CsgD family transcriptional regulator